MQPLEYIGKKAYHWIKYTKPLVITIIATVSIAVVVLLLAMKFTREHNTKVMDELDRIQKVQVQQNQFLTSRIAYGEERQRMVLFLRDEILTYWQKNRYKSGTADKAYAIASLNVTMAEKYPNVGALLLSATQFVESHWGINRLSSEGAVGLNQIMPSTGRLLCMALQREYSSGMLENDSLSTELAAKYMDLVYAHYGRWDMSLADYNGGPKQAVYFIKKDPQLSKETRDYVPAVLAKRDALQKKLEGYKADISNLTVK